MKFSIGNRLLAASLVSFLGVAVISLELVRWKLLDNFSGPSIASDAQPSANLAAALSTRYRQNGNWSFLPSDSDDRKNWLREALATADGKQFGKPTAPAASDTLGYRIGLLDGNREYLAGTLANPLIVAFASIDRVETPLRIDGKVVGYLVCATPQNPQDGLAVAFLMDQQHNIAVIIVFGLLLGITASAILAATFRKPIRQLVNGAQRLERGEFEARLNIRRTDELGQLAQTFDLLAARLEETEQRRRQWVADTSHELRTPLAILGGQIEALEDGIRAATPDNLARLRRQVNSLTKLVDDLNDLARGDVGQMQYVKQSVGVWRTVEQEFESFTDKFRHAELVAVLGVEPARSRVTGDAERLRQVIRNVLENSVRYTASGGRIEIGGCVVDNQLRIVVDDSAPGIPESSLGRLGERFFRVDDSRSRQSGGSGLGLALSRQIVAAHDGRLEFATSPLGGLRVILTLPLTT